MSGLTPVEAEFCKRVTTKLSYSPLASVFLQPVDPVNDGCPDYFQKIKEPMDLGTILEKLNAGKYSTAKEWEQDLMRIWSNAMLYNLKGTVFWLIAAKLQKKSQKLVKVIPKTEAEMWQLELLQAAKKVSKVLQFNPQSVTGSRPSQSKHPKGR
jgi:hypothetical protein